MSRLFLLLAFLVGLAPAPQQGFDAQGRQRPAGGPAVQPLDAVALQVFDKDHDGKVTLPEVKKSLKAFAGMAGAFGGDPSAGPNKMAQTVEAAERVAPALFALMDADDSKSLDAAELKWVAKVQKALKSGTLRNLTRDVFDTMDTDADSVLSEAE